MGHGAWGILPAREVEGWAWGMGLPRVPHKPAICYKDAVSFPSLFKVSLEMLSSYEFDSVFPMPKAL
ncbi:MULTISPECIES: hypothetical protein [unclassified Microcoleus]|uniref:hypothetical protein n=1 Tax=unclassified Microcoleus TaxID=2642155 RepID=UPI002FD25F63